MIMNQIYRILTISFSLYRIGICGRGCFYLAKKDGTEEECVGIFFNGNNNEKGVILITNID